MCGAIRPLVIPQTQHHARTSMIRFSTRRILLDPTPHYETHHVPCFLAMTTVSYTCSNVMLHLHGQRAFAKNVTVRTSRTARRCTAFRSAIGCGATYRNALSRWMRLYPTYARKGMSVMHRPRPTTTISYVNNSILVLERA